MFRFFIALLHFASFASGFSNLHALDKIDVSNFSHAQWPNVTEQRAEKLRGMSYEAVDAANRGDILKLHGLLYMIKNEVESMMGAQVRMEDFVDDAFRQAEAQGRKFTESQKINMKRALGISCKGLPPYDLEICITDGEMVINHMRGNAYVEQPYYHPPTGLDAGISLVIIGALVAVIPLPCCTATGGWLITAGMGFILAECVQGCERQGGRKDNWVDIRQNRYGGK